MHAFLLRFKRQPGNCALTQNTQSREKTMRSPEEQERDARRAKREKEAAQKEHQRRTATPSDKQGREDEE